MGNSGARLLGMKEAETPLEESVKGLVAVVGSLSRSPEYFLTWCCGRSIKLRGRILQEDFLSSTEPSARGDVFGKGPVLEGYCRFWTYHDVANS